MIPAEAVEAARQHLELYTERPVRDWTLEAQKLLESAAPYMLARAWEEGMAAAKLQAAGIKPARNPYRR